MKNFTYLLSLVFTLTSLQVHTQQIAQVNKLGDILESSNMGQIESSGRFSYIDGKSIVYSSDEGNTWNALQTPYDLRYGTGTIYVTTYSGLDNGNYILHTDRTMHYYDSGQWNLLQINGDSLFDEGPYVIGDEAIIIKDDALYVYDDDTKSVRLEKQMPSYCCYRVQLFKNHFLLRTQTGSELWTNDFQYVTNLDFIQFGIEAYITVDGDIIKKTRSYDPSINQYGDLIEISRDGGNTYTVVHTSNTEEYELVGDINGRLFFRGYISQPEAWSLGHLQSRMGYFDLTTGNVVEVKDGNTHKYNNLPVVVANDLYHNIGAAIIKYPDGDLNNRQLRLGTDKEAQAITKLRESSSGIVYALTSTFLYKSIDDGQTWAALLEHYSVVDFDLDDSDNLYCISSDRILKSVDDGSTFTELPRQYPLGFIDYPGEIISLGNRRLLVKGIGHAIPQSVDVGCFDCYITHPTLIFTTGDDGNNWMPEFVYSQGYVDPVTAFDAYGYLGDIAIQSDYFVKTSAKVFLIDFDEFSSLDKFDFSRKHVQLPSNATSVIDYGLSSIGVLVKNENGNVSYSTDCGSSFSTLSSTNPGQIFPGISDQSFFVISRDDLTYGSLTYQPDFNTSFDRLTVKIKDTGAAVQDSFNRVYTNGYTGFLFSGPSTYEIIELTTAVSELADSALSVISIYPNPAKGSVMLSVEDDKSLIKTVKIFDSKSRLVKTTTAAGKSVEISLGGLVTGVYFLQIGVGERVYYRKIYKTE